jgi:origin recognition complex subunit 5
MPNLGLIFISNVTLDSFYSHTGALEPLTVYFRDYTDDELHQFLIKGKPITEVYASFLKACRRFTELSTALEPLFQKYYEPISKEAVVPDENGKRRLLA